MLSESKKNPENAENFKVSKRIPRNIDKSGVAYFGVYIDPAADHPIFGDKVDDTNSGRK